MTPYDAYKTDDTFRALVDEWARERRCPRPLVDKCLELDMPLPAACARWASDEVVAPDRTPHPVPGPDELVTPCGPYPSQSLHYSGKDRLWYWHRSDRPRYVHDVRVSAVDLDHPLLGATPAEAILALMHGWRAE